MSTITAKINLAKLPKTVIIDKKGKSGDMIRGIFIPIELNHLFEGKDGAIYLDTIAFEISNPQYNDTHMVKQSLPKDVRQKMTKEQQDNQPIIGNLNANFGGGGVSSGGSNSATQGPITEDDDLPF